VVAALVKLRFLLLANTLRTSPWQIVAVVFGAVYGLGLLVLAIAGLVALSFSPVELARTVVIIAGAALTLGWVVLPLLTSGIDQTVDPSRLATFPIPINTLLVGIAASGILGVPGIVTSIAGLATAATWWHFPAASVAAVICAVVGVLNCVVGSRMMVAVTSGIGVGRRMREARGVILFVPLVLLGPIIIGVVQLGRDLGDVLPTVATVLGWTPLGAPWAVPADIAVGHWAAAILRFLIAVVTLALLIVAWRWGLARTLERPPGSARATTRTRGIGLFGVFPPTPAGAVAARALTYWMRDPRYAQSLVAVPLVPLLVLFYANLNGDLTPIIFVGPIIAILLAMSIYTDISYDNTAFALHLQTGVRGRDDRLGRVAALASFAVPISILIVVVSVWVADAWVQLPGLLGITVGALLSGFAVSSVVSARITFTVAAPGESPFTSRPGGGITLMVSTFVTWSVVSLLVLPESALAILSFATGSAVWGWMSVLVALALGGVLLVAGVRLGGVILDRRGPELLAQLQRQR